MFELLKKKQAVLPALLPRAQGFFSTDEQLLPNSPVARAAALQDAVKRSIQRSPANFKAVMADGSTAAMDDWSDSNSIKPFTAADSFVPDNQFSWYASQGFIGYQACAIILQHWLVEKACAMPARDAIRHGYEITINDGTEADPKLIDKIKELDKHFKVKHHCRELIRMGRAFGIRHVMPKVEYADPDALSKPFNIDGVTPGSYRGMVQIDPYWITPELDQLSATDPSSEHFYEPTWWRINGQRVHRSHLIIFRNGEVPDILKPTYYYGGVPLTQRIAERVYAAERTANEAPMLSMSKRSTVIHADIEAAMANQQDFMQRMQMWASFRDNYGIKILGKEETAEQFDTSLADFDAMIMTQYQLVAAISGTPATKLIGTSPKGFNATGEFEMDSYHEELESIQENDMSPLIDRHHLLLAKSHLPSFKGNITHAFEPVDSMTAKEIAEINNLNADIGNKLVNSGAIDGVDERQRIIVDKLSGYSGIEDKVIGQPDDDETDPDDEA